MSTTVDTTMVLDPLAHIWRRHTFYAAVVSQPTYGRRETRRLVWRADRITAMRAFDDYRACVINARLLYIIRCRLKEPAHG